MYFLILKEWQDDKLNRNLKHKYVWKKDDFDAINTDETDYLLGMLTDSSARKTNLQLWRTKTLLRSII